MAITLKSAQTHENMFGDTWNEGHGMITKATLYPYSEQVEIELQIFKDNTCYSNLKCCEKYEYTVTGGDFTTYFSESVLDDAAKTLLTQAEAYILDQVAYTNWETV